MNANGIVKRCGLGSRLSRAVLLLLVACSHDADTSGIGSVEAGQPLPPEATDRLILELPNSIDRTFLELERSVPGFAGLYVDSLGAAVVMLRDMTRKNQAHAEVRRFFGERVGQRPTRFEQVRYSFSELHSWRRAAQVHMPHSWLHWIDVDERRNKLLVNAVDRAAAESLLSMLLELRIPRDAFQIFEGSPVTPAVGGSSPGVAQTLRDSIRPLMAGLQIRTGVICTLGINAMWDGQPAYITNSHCTSNKFALDSTVVYQPSLGAQFRIGMEVADPALPRLTGCPSGISLCRWSDAAVIQLDEGISISTNTIAHTPLGGSVTMIEPPITTVGTGAFFYVVGDTMAKTGRTTGTSIGPVVMTCVDGATSPTGYWILCQDFVQADVDDGDSGAPVFDPYDPEGPLAYGILHARSFTAEGEPIFGFAHLVGVYNDMAAPSGDPGPTFTLCMTC